MLGGKVQLHHFGPVAGVRVNLSRDLLITYGSDGEIHLYEAKQETWVHRDFVRLLEAINIVEWSDRGRDFVAADSSGGLFQFEVTPNLQIYGSMQALWLSPQPIRSLCDWEDGYCLTDGVSTLTVFKTKSKALHVTRFDSKSLLAVKGMWPRAPMFLIKEKAAFSFFIEEDMKISLVQQPVLACSDRIKCFVCLPSEHVFGLVNGAVYITHIPTQKKQRLALEHEKAMSIGESASNEQVCVYYELGGYGTVARLLQMDMDGVWHEEPLPTELMEEDI